MWCKQSVWGVIPICKLYSLVMFSWVKPSHLSVWSSRSFPIRIRFYVLRIRDCPNPILWSRNGMGFTTSMLRIRDGFGFLGFCRTGKAALGNYAKTAKTWPFLRWWSVTQTQRSRWPSTFGDNKVPLNHLAIVFLNTRYTSKHLLRRPPEAKLLEVPQLTPS